MCIRDRQIGEQFWESVRIDGAVYGIPRLRIQPRNGLYYRADWAQRLGISEVRTLEDFYRMLTRFTYEDPDGNGRDDTYGLDFCWTDYGNKSWNGIATLTTVLGGPNYWEYRDGAMLPDFFTEEYLEALRFFRRCINEGVMSRAVSYTHLYPIESHNAIQKMREKPNSEFGRMKRSLIVGIRKTHNYTENHKVSDYLVPYTSSGCTAMCLYCYLVCNYNKCSYLRLFVNREQMLDKLIRKGRESARPLTFEIGSNSDLVLENTITGNLQYTCLLYTSRCV